MVIEAMKIFIVSLLLLLLNIGCSAQSSSPSAEEHGLTIIAKKWRLELRNPSLERDPLKEADERREEERRRLEAERTNEKLREQGMPTRQLPTRELRRETRPRGSVATYVYEVKLRNNSRKTISFVIWEYVFYSPSSGQELGRRRFESKERIRPGKTRNLVVRSPIPPTGTIGASGADGRSTGQYDEKIVIVRIE